MKVILFLLTLLLSCQTVHARQIAVHVHSEHESHNQQTFPVNGTILTLDGRQVRFGELSLMQPLGWAVSPSGYFIAFIDSRDGFGLRTADSNAREIAFNPLEFFRPDDQTLEIYSFDDGRTVVRDNVANFSFFSADGSLLYSVSNSSGSAQGERESRLASDKAGTSVVLYNPVILKPDGTGSRAAIAGDDQNLHFFFESVDEEIKIAEVSENGSFITVITTGGSGDRVHLFDRFGNELYTRVSEDALTGASLTGDGRYLTLYTSGRVQVYQTVTGELLGSASSRTTLIKAIYSPEDELIVALGGTVRGRSIAAPVLTAVHLGQRQIRREDIRQSLSLLSAPDISIKRTAESTFVVSGLNKKLEAVITF
ncbi:MAG: hypothetical protein EA360_03515 [Balneolaceae bacterium]|nr:MAG: hypothetical protein EA360_03515 [Balneolaceae bacterium]